MKVLKNTYRQIPASVRITLVYALLGSLWILVSDRLLAWLVNDPQALSYR